MASIYETMRPIADKLLTDFNQGEIKLIQMIPGTGPDHNPGPSTPDETPLKGAVQPVKGAVLLEPGTLVKAGDLRVAAGVVDGVTPTTGDRIKIDGTEYTIVRFDPIPPAGLTVTWVFFVRR